NQQLSGTLSVSCGSSSLASSAGVSAIPCKDSDNGQNYAVRGCASGGVNLCDFCSGDKHLIEVYCKDGFEVDYVHWVCPGECQNGMCRDVVSSSIGIAVSSSSSFASSSMAPACGDGRLDEGEQCEHGAAVCPIGSYCSSCRCVPFSVSSVSPPSSSSAYFPSSSAYTPVCGDDMLDPGEQCERSYSCPAPLYCSLDCQCLHPPGFSEISSISSSSSVSSFIFLPSSVPSAICGNRILERSEECEVGVVCPVNAVCNSLCKCIALYQSSRSSSSSRSVIEEEIVMESSSRSVLPIICGNGITELGEQCDDQNRINGDGCSSFCALEPGYACIGKPLFCLPVCGDGILLPFEECDDGNVANGDGCSSVCTVEHLAPPDEPPPPRVCGDGLRVAPEECDDGNKSSGDGCSADCRIEVPSSSSSLVLSSSAISTSPLVIKTSSSSTVALTSSVSAGQGNSFFLWMIIGIGSLAVLIVIVLLLRMRKRAEK
ncbi:MAG: DUF4215 domain-containing protein, partial [Candidatus Peribacteraceae bacterium]|nr:DUF4215 domain-containing protein [Candidatus Peribacteraceae bacterium]